MYVNNSPAEGYSHIYQHVAVANDRSREPVANEAGSASATDDTLTLSDRALAMLESHQLRQGQPLPVREPGETGYYDTLQPPAPSTLELIRNRLDRLEFLKLQMPTEDYESERTFLEGLAETLVSMSASETADRPNVSPLAGD